MNITTRESITSLYAYRKIKERTFYFLNGIGTKVWFHMDGLSGYIEEGQFRDNDLQGFGRKLYSYGDGFIGQFKKGRFHGYGLKLHDGEMVEGLFEDREMKGFLS
jgi:hypothetical protein